MPLKALIGCIAALALMLAVPVQAEPVRIPQQGEPAYAFNAPPGWQIIYDEHQNLQFRRNGVVLQLSMASGAALAGLELDRLAAQILKSAGFPPYKSWQVGSIAGRPGRIYFAAKSQGSVTVELSLTLVRIDDTHIATLTRVTGVGAAAADLASLEDLVAQVRFVGVK
jgi:hypothetical protein